MLVVDSSVWIDFFNGVPPTPARPAGGTLRRLLADGEVELLLPDLVAYEVLRGFRDERDFRQAQRLLAGVRAVDTGGAALAHAAAQHYRSLRAAGITVRSAVDVLIATYCIEHDVSLLHDDRDFEPFEQHRGLKAWRH